MPFARCALFAAMLALAACSTGARQEAASVEDRLRLAGQRQDACYAELKGDPVAARVGAYLVADADDPARARKEGDRRRVTAEMRRDLLEFRRKVGGCRDVASDGFGAVDPAYARVLALTHEAEDRILVALLNRRLRVGEANRRSLEVDRLSDAAWDATTSSLVERPDGDTEAARTLRREVAAAALRRLSERREELAGLGGPATEAGCRLTEGAISCGSS